MCLMMFLVIGPSVISILLGWAALGSSTSSSGGVRIQIEGRGPAVSLFMCHSLCLGTPECLIVGLDYFHVCRLRVICSVDAASLNEQLTDKCVRPFVTL
jgi:hypothetical protein